MDLQNFNLLIIKKEIQIHLFYKLQNTVAKYCLTCSFTIRLFIQCIKKHEIFDTQRKDVLEKYLQQKLLNHNPYMK